MKKIIVAFDGLKFSESAMEYAVMLAQQTSAHLVGVFLDDFLRHGYKMYELISKAGSKFEVVQKKLDLQDEKTRKLSTQKFDAACRKSGVEHSLHHDRNVAARELLRESIYADLLIIDSSETMKVFKENAPGEFIRDLLAQVQCPVLMVSSKYKPVQKLVLLFDGSPTSVYAIKMFSYNLAALKQAPAEVVTVKHLNQSQHLPDNKLMKEFMKRHFPRATYKVFNGIPEDEIVKYLRSLKENALVVLGAYRRGSVSRWFRSSMADTLVRELKLPLFIAHNH